MSFAIGRTKDQSPIISSKSADYTILDNDNIDTYLVTTGSSSNVVMTLPDPALNNGRVIKFVKADSGTKFVEIEPNGAENIRGSNTSIYLIMEGESLELYCDGTNWLLLGNPMRTVSIEVDENSGTPQIANQSCTWVSSITDNGSGDYSLNIISGVFSASPYAAGNIKETGSAKGFMWFVSKSTSAIRYRMGRSTTETLTDYDNYLVVVGKK